MDSVEETALFPGLILNKERFVAATTCRAEAINRPIEKMYRHILRLRAEATDKSYRNTGDPASIVDIIEGDSADSFRNYESLYRQVVMRFTEKPVRTQVRILAGVEYVIITQNGGRPSLSVSLLLTQETNSYRTAEGVALAAGQ